jgi:phosphatidylethanolamine/phosphatidyl-N-methylethanolamine N-methyltransferase
MGLFLFLKEFFQHPASIGSVFPSSVLLGKTIADQIPKNTSGYVVEIGPGTGVITKMILKSGVAPERFIAIERSESFYHHLKKRFPEVNIIHGDATHIADLLGEKAHDVAVIVSGLPLRSLPPEVAKNIGQSMEKVLKPHGLFIQFTYSWVKNHFSLPKTFHYAYSKRIFLNLPPARVDVFKATKKNF